MKLQESDILKHGAEIKAFKLNPSNPKVKQAIDETVRLQEDILALKIIDPDTLNQVITI